MIIKAGQAAVVTGAAQGLGRALTAGLIDRGVSVVLADIAAERLHSTAEEFTARSARVLPVITDVSNATGGRCGDVENYARHRAEGILAALDDQGWYEDHGQGSGR